VRGKRAATSQGIFLAVDGLRVNEHFVCNRGWRQSLQEVPRVDGGSLRHSKWCMSAACLDCASVGAGGVYGGKTDVRVGEGVSNRQYEVARVVIKVCGGKRSKAGGCARPCVKEQALCVCVGGCVC
jgi:hypothetical protein